MPFYPSTVRNIMEARGLTIEEVSKVAGMSVKKVHATLDGQNIPTKNQIVNLASRMAVPPHAFFAPHFTVSSSPIVDFRAPKPDSLKYGKDASKFEYIFRLRNFLETLFNRLDLDAPEKLFSSEPDENPEQFAKSVENILELNSIREKAKDKADFFRLFRLAVEELGIFVIQDHNISVNIDGFALHHEKFTSNLIFINTLKRNHGAKSFTLAHELSHIFGKRSAISNNYEYDNEIETYANEFAASLLIPRENLLHELNTKKYFFTSYDVTKQSAERLSEIFKCSVSAMLVRLERLGYSKRDYTKTFLSGFGKPSFLDTDKPQVFGSKDGPKPGVVDLAYLGVRATSILVSALERGLTTKYEIFENTGLSKKRIEGLVQISTDRQIIKEHI
jgi:Zn-dependent peptidase ImmA (M78 family)